METNINTFEQAIGNGTNEEFIDEMQYLVDTNIAWLLKGHVATVAMEMIDAGYLRVTMQ